MNWTSAERKAFDTFISQVNSQSTPTTLHPNDEQRWDDFVITSHNQQSSLSRSDVESEFGKTVFKSDAGKWADRYEQDRTLLERYDRSKA